MPATTLACRRPLRKLELVGAVGPEACWLIEQLRRWFLETGADLDPVEAEALIDQVQKGEIVAIGPAVAGIEASPIRTASQQRDCRLLPRTVLRAGN